MKIRNKVLIGAIIISAACHVFWLSVFSVTAVPKVKKTVKFSNVSFLGPILGSGVLNVDITAPQQSALEKKYITFLAIPPLLLAAPDNIITGHKLSAAPSRPYYGADEVLIALSAVSIDSKKAEPGRDID